ncbi:MAG: exonuclease [Robiginitomaculum sp.]|nr:MAG: exonuclease [Robiginitomaculum sp.]
MTTFIAIDVETANSDSSSICQIGIAIYMRGVLSKSYNHLVDPQVEYSNRNIGIHGISADDTFDAPIFSEVFPVIAELLEGVTVISHTMFDRSSFKKACRLYDVAFPECDWVDSSMIARRAWPDVAKRGYGLMNLCERIEFDYTAHDAEEDAIACGQVVVAALEHTGWTFDQAISESRSSTNKWAGKRVAKEGNPSGKHYGKTIVFTGDLPVKRSVVARLAAQKGYTIKDNISKKADYLIVGNNFKNTGKFKRAYELQKQGHHIVIDTLSQIFTAKELIEAEEAVIPTQAKAKLDSIQRKPTVIKRSARTRDKVINSIWLAAAIYTLIMIIVIIST